MKLAGYTWRPVSGLERDPVLDVVHGVILHVDAGNATSLFNWFNGRSGGIESHVFIPKTPEYAKEQFRDTTREADANYLANRWESDGKTHGFISAETQGYGAGKWNEYQLDSIKDLILQTSKEHKFPLQVPKTPKGFGVGYHTLFEDWSNVRGKTCPGPERINQFHRTLKPWMQEQNVKTYTVKKSDTAPKIARRFGLEVWELWRLNPGKSIPFKVGQKVKVR